MFPPEGSLRVAAVARHPGAVAPVASAATIGRKRDRSIFIQAEAGRRDLPAFKGYTARLQGQVSRESTPIWQKGLDLRLWRRADRDQRGPDGLPAAFAADAFFLAGLSGQVGYDRRTACSIRPRASAAQGFRQSGDVAARARASPISAT
jgi:translocation and assembly module TamA